MKVQNVELILDPRFFASHDDIGNSRSSSRFPRPHERHQVPASLFPAGVGCPVSFTPVGEVFPLPRSIPSREAVRFGESFRREFGVVVISDGSKTNAFCRVVLLDKLAWRCASLFDGYSQQLVFPKLLLTCASDKVFEENHSLALRACVYVRSARLNQQFPVNNRVHRM